MTRTRTKICGITRIEDALCAARAGADAIGLIFYAGSPRAVNLEQALLISNSLPPFVSTVALFVNAPLNEVDEVIMRVRPTILQFHGDENPAFCTQFRMPFLKAIRVGGEMTTDDLLEYAEKFSAARALLLDTMSQGLYGGSGKAFDWQVIPHEMRRRIVLSGGLQADNVAGAIRMIKPWAVDVSSGVEAQKGVKDHAKIAKFIEEVRNADAG